ncbi:MAG: hypothetical protein QXI09_02035 [Candidatus Aenigmatarchaeota archaeon]
MKNVVGILKSKIFGKNRLETVENIFIAILLFSSILLSISIGLSAIFPRGIVTIIAMLSSFSIFIFTIFLIIVWIIREV